MSGFNNYYDDPFSENPFSSHFSSPSNQPTVKENVKYNDKLLNNRFDFPTNNTSILERNNSIEAINTINNDVNDNDIISKSSKDNSSLQKRYSQDNFCCATHFAFTSNKEKIPLITITDALKITDMSGSSFIAYVIKTIDPDNNSTLLEVRRRYSEFASLRNLLHQYYPSLIIPPIPEKHSITEYAIKQGKAKDNPKIIEKRKRMLQVFLNRLGKHPIFASLHIFHVFLEPGNWLEYEQKMAKVSIPISVTTFDITEELQYKEIKKRVKEFMKCIALLSKAHHGLTGVYNNLSQSYSSLGASYNGWSLHEIGLSPVLESIGQSSDSNRLALCRMISLLDITIMESLQEYNSFSKIILNIIAWYKNNYRQYYYICSSLNKKQRRLEALKRAEVRDQQKSEAMKIKEMKKKEKELEKAKEKEAKLLQKQKQKDEKKDDDESITSSIESNLEDGEKPKDDNILHDPLHDPLHDSLHDPLHDPLHDSHFNDVGNSNTFSYPENIPTSNDFNHLNASIFNNDLTKQKSPFETLDHNAINPKIDDDDDDDVDIFKPTNPTLKSQDPLINNEVFYHETNSVDPSFLERMKKEDLSNITINGSFITTSNSRQHEIRTVKEHIVRLQQLKETQYKELIRSGKEIQYDFTYFQREKYSDFKQILIQYAKINREYNEQMIKVWNTMIRFME